MVRAIIVDHKSNQWNTDFGHWAKIYCENPTGLYLPKTIFICRWIIFLHVSEEEMIHSQLFGRLGEEVVQLVDPMDSEKLKKFRRLAVNSSPQLPDTREFFKLMDTPAFKKQLTEDLEKTRQLFVWNMWLAAYANRFRGVPDPEDIWTGPRTRDGLPLDMLSPDTYCDPDFPEIEDQEDYAPNANHPWVKEVLDMRPDFGLRVMFRPCPDQCWVPSTPTRPYPPRFPSGNAGSTPPLLTGPLTRCVSPTDLLRF